MCLRNTSAESVSIRQTASVFMLFEEERVAIIWTFPMRSLVHFKCSTSLLERILALFLIWSDECAASAMAASVLNSYL